MNPFRASRIGKKWLVAGVVLLAVGVAELAGIRSLPDQLRGMRSPNKADEFYRYMAQELAEPAICKRIPWSVMKNGGWFYSPSYERSECYETLAGNTRNPWLCLKVKRLGAFSVINSQTSMWSCLNEAFHGFQSGMAISQADLIGFFNQMGYDPDTLHLEGITPPIVSVKDLYRELPDRIGLAIRSQSAGGPVEVVEPGLVDQHVLVKRIENVIGGPDRPANGKNIDAADVAYLADMAALVSRDFQWCFRIAEDLPLAGQRRGFRNWCIFTVARETKDAQLCNRIPIPTDGTDARLSLQADCRRESGSSLLTTAHSAPEVPADDNQVRVLLALLQVKIPRARDLPPDRINAAYDRFLDELSEGKDAAHAAARQRFIDRVMQLPTNN